MKIFKTIVYGLLAMGVVSAATLKSCTQSYECGSQPFAICYNMTSQHMLPGIDLDIASHSVVFINRLSAVGGSDPKDTAFFGHVSMDGGNFEVIEEIKSDAKVPNGQNVIQMKNYLGSKKIPYIVNSMPQGNAGVGPYNKGTFTRIWSVLSVYLGMAFDEPNNIMYSCDFDIRKYNKIPMTFDDRADNVTMYKNQMCSDMDYHDGKLYFSASLSGSPGTAFYKADLSCVNCDKSTLTALYTESNYVHSFATSNSNQLFFATSSGVFQVNLDNTAEKKQLSADTDASYFVYHEGFLYYQTQTQIKSVEIATGKVKVLYDSHTVVTQNQCMCATGFEGDQCDKCDGNIQWNNGQPRCFEKGETFFCAQDYECGNVPFTQCFYGTCQCRNNFYGEKCDECDGTLHWNQGIPTCEPTTH